MPPANTFLKPSQRRKEQESRGLRREGREDTNWIALACSPLRSPCSQRWWHTYIQQPSRVLLIQVLFGCEHAFLSAANLWNYPDLPLCFAVMEKSEHPADRKGSLPCRNGVGWHSDVSSVICWSLSHVPSFHLHNELQGCPTFLGWDLLLMSNVTAFYTRVEYPF